MLAKADDVRRIHSTSTAESQCEHDVPHSGSRAALATHAQQTRRPRCRRGARRHHRG